MFVDSLRRRFDYYLGKAEVVIYSVLAALLAVSIALLRRYAPLSKDLPEL